MKQFGSYILQMIAISILAGNVVYAQNNLFIPGPFQPAKIKAVDLTKNEPLAKTGYLVGAYVWDVTVVSEPQTAEDVDKLVPQDTYALPWAAISERNIVWTKRVWRTIDTRGSKNNALSNNPEIHGIQKLPIILLTGFIHGKYKAYSADDDRFTTELTGEQVLTLLAKKTSAHPGSENSSFDPDKINKFRIKEDWLYLDTQKIWVVRIVGIAPVREITASNGTVTDKPLFWLYYPDIRNYLSQQAVYTSGKNVAEYNWDKLFEGRDFYGKIDKVSDNSTSHNSQYIIIRNPRDITR